MDKSKKKPAKGSASSKRKREQASSRVTRAKMNEEVELDSSMTSDVGDTAETASSPKPDNTVQGGLKASKGEDPFERMMKFLDNKLDTKFNSLSKDIVATTYSIEGLSSTVRNNAAEIKGIKEELNALKSKDLMREQIREVIREETKVSQAVPDRDSERRRAVLGVLDRRATQRDVGEETKYMFARRSLRMWPISGAKTSDLWEAVGDFLQKCLRIPRSSLAESDVEEVRRITDAKRNFRRENRVSSITNEVLVVFKDTMTRDMVLSYAPNLSDWRGSKGGNVGIRIEIPIHLKQVFNTLQNHGFSLREEHGPELKRHVKFDDEERSLFLHVKLPGETEWIRVDHEYARERRRDQERLKFNAARMRLNSASAIDDDSPKLVAEYGPVPSSAPPFRTSTKNPFGSTPMQRLSRQDVREEAWGKSK